MKNKFKIFVMFMILLVTPIFVSAGTPHSVFGTLSNADGATITVYIDSRSSEILTDVIGKNGNSGVEGSWLIDVGNFPTAWSVGENLVIELSGQDIEGSTTLTLNDAGNQEVNDLSINKIDEVNPQTSQLPSSNEEQIKTESVELTKSDLEEVNKEVTNIKENMPQNLVSQTGSNETEKFIYIVFITLLIIGLGLYYIKKRGGWFKKK